MDDPMTQLFVDFGIKPFDQPRFSGRLYAHNVDKKFASQNLNHELRGPTHDSIQLEVLNTWRLEFPMNASPRSHLRLLLHGAPKQKIREIVERGFIMNHQSGKERVFGPGFYFSNTSTKEINLTVPACSRFEHHHDIQAIKPKDGEVGYLLYCEVEASNLLSQVSRDKRNRSQDSKPLVMLGRYMNRNIDQCTTSLGEQIDVFRGPIEFDPCLRGRKIPNDIRVLNYAEYCVFSPASIRPVILVQIRTKY